MSVKDRFSLEGRVVAITGGAGLLGAEHAAAVAEAGGIPVPIDLDLDGAQRRAAEAGAGFALAADVTDEASLERARDAILERAGRIDGLVNNAAWNPKVEGEGLAAATRLERMPLAEWQRDLDVGLTGAFLCSRVLGAEIARGEGGGRAIVNVASDLALISPDQRLYRVPGVPEDQQPVKPVTYSVVKAGLIGLTRWLATYWAESGVRVNAISPGGVEAGQPEEFVARLSERIPLGRMARRDEYRAAIVFLLSDASSYMTGHNLVIDGGRTVW
jgi:NAD(P)-dependent dehydrogenase (short-subunit alcohol dehydrogenase family)